MWFVCEDIVNDEYVIIEDRCDDNDEYCCVEGYNSRVAAENYLQELKGKAISEVSYRPYKIDGKIKARVYIKRANGTRYKLSLSVEISDVLISFVDYVFQLNEDEVYELNSLIHDFHNPHFIDRLSFMSVTEILELEETYDKVD